MYILTRWTIDSLMSYKVMVWLDFENFDCWPELTERNQGDMLSYCRSCLHGKTLSTVIGPICLRVSIMEEALWTAIITKCFYKKFVISNQLKRC